MLDHFSILTQGGLVLWSRSFTPSPSPFDSLIREALIEQRASSTDLLTSTSASSSVSRWDKDAHALLWLLANDLDLVFCVAYQRILSLPYVADLLDAVRKAFLRAYRDAVQAIVDSSARGKDVLVAAATGAGAAPGSAAAAFALFGEDGWAKVFQGWDETFNRILRDFESSAAKNKKLKPRAPSGVADAGASPSSSASEAATPSLADPADGALDAQTIARNIAALKARQKAAQRKSGRKSGAGTESEGAGSESDGTPTKPRGPRKAATKWADSNISEADLAAYDYSSDAPSPARGGGRGAAGSRAGTPALEDVEVDTRALVDRAALGKRDGEGLYEVADYQVRGAQEDDDDDEEDEEDEGDAAGKDKPQSALSSFFSRLSLQPRALTAQDLAPTLAAMQQHLMAKNVARDIAEQVVAGVGKTLEGKKVDAGLFSSSSRAGKRAVRDALNDALVRILTPKTSTDLLLEIQRKRSSASAAAVAVASSSSSSSSFSGTKGGKGVGADPYAITFVGVNGVGKSTNLSKVAFWLLQNRLRVLIAACDTFRSGAVEQLRVHVRNLGKLDDELSGGGGAGAEGEKRVELFEKGYGKDAAGIAKDALAYAKQAGFDVVLIDTAGRMQDNEPLMRALAKLIAVNQPDKIIFVGEALVGNEAVDQLTKFNRSLRDFSGSAGAGGGGGGGGVKGGPGKGRGVDGMILTKFDTIDDKVGAALSMTYVTGQPIYFVGTGQTYSDLRMLRVGHIVQALMQD